MNSLSPTFLRHASASAILALCGAWPAGVALAQGTYPSKTITVVVPYPAGGSNDTFARQVAKELGDRLGQPVIIDNRPGASGNTGTGQVARAAPDGYTLMVGYVGTHGTNPALRKLPYDAVADFTPIAMVGGTPNVLVVHPSLAAKSVPELIQLARKQPGHYTYASSGIGSTQHLAGALFDKLADTKMVHIPYKGSGQAVVDMLAGQVDMNFDTMPPVLEHARNGKLRALAISTPARLSQLPDVPTFSEVGIRGFDVTNWYSIMGPKGLPRDIVARMDDAVQKAMQDPSIRPKLEAQGLQFGGPKTPEEFDRFIKDEVSKYARLTKELNVKAE